VLLYPQVCSYFLAGHCAYGKQCKFAHLYPDGTSAERDPSQQRSPAAQPQDDPPGSSQPAGTSGSSAPQPPRTAAHHRQGAADSAWYEGAEDAAEQDPRLPEHFLDTPRADQKHAELGECYAGPGEEHAYYDENGQHAYYSGYEGEGYAHQNGYYEAHEPQIIDDDEHEFASEDSIQEAVRQSYLGWVGDEGAPEDDRCCSLWAPAFPALRRLQEVLQRMHAQEQEADAHSSMRAQQLTCCVMLLIRPTSFSAAVGRDGAANASSAAGREEGGEVNQQGLCAQHTQAGYCSRGAACPLLHGHYCQVRVPVPATHGL
jgi:hypothetical protein